MTEDVLQQIAAGNRILYRVFNAKDCGNRMRAAFGKFGDLPGLKFFPASRRIKHESGGYVHFVFNDEDVRGREYHMSYGYLTPVMRSRVRLEPRVPASD